MDVVGRGAAAPIVRVSDELWNAAIVWSSRRLRYDGSSVAMWLLLDPHTQEPLQVEDIARPPFLILLVILRLIDATRDCRLAILPILL